MSGREEILVRHDPSCRAIHAINSQLLEMLFGSTNGVLREILFDPSVWIINVLYLHCTPISVPILRTSSTFHRGSIFDHTKSQCGAIDSIDETVPLASSVSGKCVTSERPIWLVMSDLKNIGDSFADRFYRRFSLVDVKTSGYNFPRAEVVFPIASHQFGTSTAVGVLNMELFFGNSADNIHGVINRFPRESLNEFFAEFLSYHAPFLQIATNLQTLWQREADPHLASAEQSPDYDCELFDTSVVELVNAHRHSLSRYLFRHQRWLDQLVRVVSGLSKDARSIEGGL